MLPTAASAVLYAAQLLVLSFLGLIAALVAIWVALRVVRYTTNRRKASVAIMPLIGMVLHTVARTPPLVTLAVPFLLVHRFAGAIDLTTPEAVRYGEYIFSLSFVLILCVAVPRAYGLSLRNLEQQVAPRRVFAIKQVRLQGGFLVGLLVGSAHGPWGMVAVVVAGVTYSGGLTRILLGAVADLRRASSPEVVPISDVVTGDPVVIHVSDMHVTDRDGRVPTGDGASGLPQLQSLAAALTSIATPLPIVIASGDLVDRGAPAEWDRGITPLLAIARAGASVVLAPGNHDVLPSYTSSGLIWAAIQPGVSTPVVDGNLVWRYFDRAVQLEPRLTTCEGRSLAAYLADVRAPWEGLEQMWNGAREEAIALGGLSPGTRHAAALRKYRAHAPGPSDALEERFVTRATTLYPEIPPEYWRKHIYMLGPDSIAELWKGAPWIRRWYEPYPLRLSLENGAIEVLVVNSNPPAPLLAQSSLGASGQEQLARLDTLLASSTARTTIVVHHHAVAAWTGDATGFARWGILAHDAAESQQLFAMLLGAGRNRNVLLLTGHVHEDSRYGFVGGPEGGGFWYLESAALGEEKGARRLGLVRTAEGGLRPTILQ